MTDSPIHAWMLPRLQHLLEEAAAAGFDRAPCVAVIADIAMQPGFNDAPPVAEPDHPGRNIPVPPVQEEYDAPSLGSTEWIKETGDPSINR